jgi:hypothetical protein
MGGLKGFVPFPGLLAHLAFLWVGAAQFTALQEGLTVEDALVRILDPDPRMGGSRDS